MLVRCYIFVCAQVITCSRVLFGLIFIVWWLLVVICWVCLMIVWCCGYLVCLRFCGCFLVVSAEGLLDG